MGQLRIAVIGGGASGMMAAITAARGGAEVYLFERNDRVGKKILATGNGKCNFSNLNLDKSFYFCDDETVLVSVLSKFRTDDILSFFETAGMLTKERNQYLYPATEQASTVLDIFRILLKKERVTLVTDEKIEKIEWNSEKNLFYIYEGKSNLSFHKVILATGGKASPKTGSDGSGFCLAKTFGHSIIPVIPALVQLRCRENFLKSIAGVRTDALVKLMVGEKEVASERGELQFTDYGVSGIVVFQVSRIASYAIKEKKDVKLYIDCMPAYSDSEYEILKQKRKELCKDAETIEDFFTGFIHKKIMQLFIRLTGLKSEDCYQKALPEKIEQVFSYCKKLCLRVNGTNSFDQAQVSAGGVPLREVTGNLESKIYPGLFFAGEILNVDGKCGGYNLHWAWASGHMAGSCAVSGERNTGLYDKSTAN